jgi:general stress protein 26
MSDKTKTPAELQERLWKEIGKERIVMLGLTGGEDHLQPMAAFADEAQNAIWFFTKRSTDLVETMGAGHKAMICVMAKDQEFQACIMGELKPDHDSAKIDQYWSPFVAAWYPDGKADPDLTLVRFDPSDARIWASNRGPLNYPMQIAKANATHELPDVGDTADVSF